MKLGEFLSVIDSKYIVFAGAPTIGYHYVGTDSFNQDWIDYDIGNIHILWKDKYQVNLIPPKKPWAEPYYIIGKLVGANDLPKGCCSCSNVKIKGKCNECYSHSNWKNMFIKEN